MQRGLFCKRWPGWVLATAMIVAACGGSPTLAPIETVAQSPTAAAVEPAAVIDDPPVDIPVSPTPTEEPLAAIVNGEPITLAAYELAIERYEASLQSLGLDLEAQSGYRMRVLNQMVDDRLMVQAAELAGLTVEAGELEAVYAQSVADLGGEAGFNEWLAFSILTEEQFREQLYTQLLVGKTVTQITDAIPDALPQVHARHILVGDETTAGELRARLVAGEDFAELAKEFSKDQSSRINGGDLGWFSRGVLTVPAVEDAAFGLTPDEISPVVRSFLGYHIIQTLEISESRPLSSEVREVLQRSAIQEWLSTLQTQAIVERYISTADS